MLVPVSTFPQWTVIVEKMMECYKIIGELDDDDLRYVHILDIETSQDLEGRNVASKKFLQSLKINKVKLGPLKILSSLIL